MAYIPKATRQKISIRANHSCEYCLIPEQVSFFTYQIEHIVSIKHKGKNTLDNLALACPICNRYKGSDLGSNVGDPPILIRFFNPRIDIWKEHFQLKKSGKIIALSDIGKATSSIFKLNHDDAVLQRKKLISIGVLEI